MLPGGTASTLGFLYLHMSTTKSWQCEEVVCMGTGYGHIGIATSNDDKSHEKRACHQERPLKAVMMGW